MAGLKRTVSCRVEFDLSDDYIDITYESETDDQFATVTVGEVVIRSQELDGLIDGLIKIRDEVRKYESEDAVAPAARAGIGG